jgi:hypothetical protein
MTPADHEKVYEILTTRLARQAKMMWILLAGAFAVGGWAAIQQSNIATLYERMAKMDARIENMAARQEVIAATVADLKKDSYTFREAQAVTERLAVLETKFVSLTQILDEKINRLAALLQKQSAITPDGVDTIAAQ